MNFVKKYWLLIVLLLIGAIAAYKFFPTFKTWVDNLAQKAADAINKIADTAFSGLQLLEVVVVVVIIVVILVFVEVPVLIAVIVAAAVVGLWGLFKGWFGSSTPVASTTLGGQSTTTTAGDVISFEDAQAVGWMLNNVPPGTTQNPGTGDFTLPAGGTFNGDGSISINGLNYPPPGQG